MQLRQRINRARSPGSGGTRNELEFGYSRQPFLDENAKLGARQISAQTGMCAAAEADVMHAAPVKAYFFGVGKTLRVEVMQRTREQNVISRSDRDSSYIEILHRDSP